MQWLPPASTSGSRKAGRIAPLPNSSSSRRTCDTAGGGAGQRLEHQHAGLVLGEHVEQDAGSTSVAASISPISASNRSIPPGSSRKAVAGDLAVDRRKRVASALIADRCAGQEGAAQGGAGIGRD